jgi:hypothetical protein
MKRYKKTGPQSDHKGVSVNLLKPICLAGAKAKAEGKKRSDNPYIKPSQSYRRWERGFEYSDTIAKMISPEPVKEVTTEETPKKKRTPRKKKIEIA